jgi:tRNA dimethylallyltransferase
MRTVGYREAVEHLEGLCSAGEMRERIQRHTRNYAKRQETWFRADGRIRWYPVGEEGELDGIADRIADDFLSTF